mmetsp:Transcript_14028/g.20381  ORF Transcript_14028/g.20381 Transcript_14028/m.20381 type:complete len:96 (+) Transcript_14028:470-757(+)
MLIKLSSLVATYLKRHVVKDLYSLPFFPINRPGDSFLQTTGYLRPHLSPTSQQAPYQFKKESRKNRSNPDAQPRNDDFMNPAASDNRYIRSDASE